MVDESGPGEEHDDDGGLEGEGEDEDEEEDEVDVIGDAVLLGDESGGGEVCGDDLAVGEVDAELVAGCEDPGGAGCGVDGVGVEDGDGGECDALRERGGWRVGLCDADAEEDEEVEHEREQDFVEECGADDGECGGEGDEEACEALFVGVEAGADEEPELPEAPRDGDDEGGDHGDLEVGAEGFDGGERLEGWRLVCAEECAFEWGDDESQE